MYLVIIENILIVLVGVVGCEEMMFMFFYFKCFVKIFGMLYLFFIMSLLLFIKVCLYFGEFMYFEGFISNEDEVVIKVEWVKEEINKLIEKGLQV